MPNRTTTSSDAPHLPRSAPIEAYGKGGFAFADMSHRGSLLCLPDGIWAWPVTKLTEIDEYSLGRVFKAANSIDTLIVGTGTERLGAAARPPRGAAGGPGGAGPDADGACHPNLQHHAGRAAAGRGGADRGAMSAGEPSKDSAAFCADLVRTHDFARYASTLFVPAPQRRALLAVYAFNVEISRVRDQVSQPLPGEIRMQWWTDMLDGAGHGEVEGNPVAAELLQVIRDFRLPVGTLSRLIEEHQFDLYNDPMPSMAALEGYVTDTSSALFSLGARIAAPPSEAIDHLARHAGLAQGMAQVIARYRSMPRGASYSCRCNCCSSTAAASRKYFRASRRGGRARRSTNWIGEARKHLATAFDLLATRTAAGAAGVPAARAGPPRPAARIARGCRSLCAAGDVAVRDVVDAVARVAVARVWRVGKCVEHSRRTPRRRGTQYAAASRSIAGASGILDHPPSRVMTAIIEAAVANSTANSTHCSRN